MTEYQTSVCREFKVKDCEGCPQKIKDTNFCVANARYNHFTREWEALNNETGADNRNN